MNDRPTLEEAARAYVAAWHDVANVGPADAVIARVRLDFATHDLVAIADGECAMCEPGTCPLDIDTTARAGDLLTDAEHYALALTGELANLCRRIVGDGPAAAADWDELAYRIHAVQHMIRAQAAARAYPTRYRALGQTVQREEVTP